MCVFHNLEMYLIGIWSSLAALSVVHFVVISRLIVQATRASSGYLRKETTF